jgi:hypothetical protein
MSNAIQPIKTVTITEEAFEELLGFYLLHNHSIGGPAVPDGIDPEQLEFDSESPRFKPAIAEVDYNDVNNNGVIHSGNVSRSVSVGDKVKLVDPDPSTDYSPGGEVIGISIKIDPPE